MPRTLTDLTADERHVLSSTAPLQAFDLTLATAAASLLHQSAAARLVERPSVSDNTRGLWPVWLHSLVRSTPAHRRGHHRRPADTLRLAPAAQRAHAALGEQLRTNPGPSGDRRWLVGCLRQGLGMARDFALDLGRLTDAAWAHVSYSVGEPPTRDGDEADEEARSEIADTIPSLTNGLTP